jgi:hypothetical protein
MKAGVAGRVRHDLRRTSVRNMVNAGVSERVVAMTVTGHNTRALFDRYHIVAPGDLQDVARRLTGTFSGTSGGGAIDGSPVSGYVFRHGRLAQLAEHRPHMPGVAGSSPASSTTRGATPEAHMG